MLVRVWVFACIWGRAKMSGRSVPTDASHPRDLMSCVSHQPCRRSCRACRVQRAVACRREPGHQEAVRAHPTLNPKPYTLNQVIKPKPYTPNQVIKRLSGLTQRAVVSIGVAGATGA